MKLAVSIGLQGLARVLNGQIWVVPFVEETFIALGYF